MSVQSGMQPRLALHLVLACADALDCGTRAVWMCAQANDAVLAGAGPLGRRTLSAAHQAEADDEDDDDDDEDEDEDDGDDGAGIAAALISQGALDLGSLNPEVLATLPQSLQLDILEKMRDAQQAGAWGCLVWWAVCWDHQ